MGEKWNPNARVQELDVGGENSERSRLRHRTGWEEEGQVNGFIRALRVWGANTGTRMCFKTALRDFCNSLPTHRKSQKPRDWIPPAKQFEMNPRLFSTVSNISPIHWAQVSWLQGHPTGASWTTLGSFLPSLWGSPSEREAGQRIQCGYRWALADSKTTGWPLYKDKHLCLEKWRRSVFFSIWWHYWQS